MSEDALSKLVTMTVPLLGVVVGGLLSYLTARGVDREKGRRDRQEKLAALRREALSAALEWIEPMRNAQIRASSLVMAAVQGDVDGDDFRKRFPYLLGNLTKMDLTGSQRAIIPDDVYARGLRVVHEMDELRALGSRHGGDAQYAGKLMPGLEEAYAKAEAIRKEISALEDDLGKAFLATFA